MYSSNTSDVIDTYQDVQLKSENRYESLLSSAIDAYAELYRGSHCEAELLKHLRSLITVCGSVPRNHRIFDLAKSLQSLVLTDMGEFKKAALVAQQGINHKLNSSQCWHALGHAQMADGEFTSAIKAFSKAIAIDPNALTYRSSLAQCRLRHGNTLEAFNLYRSLLSLAPNNSHIRSQLVISMQYIRAHQYNDELEKLLNLVLSWSDIDLSDLAPLVNNLLCHKYDINESTLITLTDEQRTHLLELVETDTLFHHCLNRVGIRTALFEQFVLMIRDACVINNALIGGQFFERTMSSVSEYQRLSGYLLAPHLANQDCIQSAFKQVDKELYHALSTMFVQAPLVFNQRHNELVAIDSVGQEVQMQYEQFPYPAWTKLSSNKRSSYLLALKRHSVTTASYLNNLTRPMRVMIAGCGTGKHALQVARDFSNINVFAADLSAASLTYAKEQAIHLGISNIQFTQLDLLQLTEQNPHFDIIECSGVIHHSNHPDRMLANLIKQLLPGGLIKLGMYSRLARAEITAFRRSHPEVTNVHDARALVLADPKQYPQIIKSPDFWHTSGVHDLLLNRYERQYNLLEIEQMLCLHNCEFLNFVGVADEHRKRVNAQFKCNNKSLLATWHEYESEHPTLFNSMYQMYIRPRR